MSKIIALLILIAATLPGYAQVSVTELLASNQGGLRDEDGDSSDWAEIYNGSGATVNLNGWHLTDSAGNLTKWTFPATNILAGGYLIVFCSGKNRIVPGAPLHTSFGLSAASEYIAIVNPDGTTVSDSYAFSQQTANISYGHGADMVAHFYDPPTPGATNGTFATAGAPIFSVQRGWFEATNFDLNLSSASPNSTIYFTTNGSEPYATVGEVFFGSIPMNGTRVVRARTESGGRLPSAFVTHSYLFLDSIAAQSTNGVTVRSAAANYTLATNITVGTNYGPAFKSNLLSIPTLSIVSGHSNLFGRNGVYANPQGSGVQWERPVSVEYMRPDGVAGFMINCGLRMKGGASRTVMPKHGLRLFFRASYGTANLDYPLYPDEGAADEFDTLVLHASFGDHWLYSAFDGTELRDQWMRDTQNALGGYAPHGTYVHLYLNGLYWGLHNIGEKGDHHFAADYLGGDDDEYDVFSDAELVAGTTNAFYTLLGIGAAGLTNDLAYTNFQFYLDPTNFIDYMMMNFYAANSDWPSHNWDTARRRTNGATFHFFSWDAEQSIGLFSSVITDIIPSTNTTLANLCWAGRGHPEFRRLFGDRVQRAMFEGGALTPDAGRARWNRRAEEIEQAIIGESSRWGGGYTKKTWAATLETVRQWFPQRHALFITHLRSANLFPTLNAPIASQRGGLVGSGYTLGLTNNNGTGSILFTTNGVDPRAWGGGTASVARVFTSLVLTNTATNYVRVMARVKDGTNWSALTDCQFWMQALSGLVVTELAYHPPDVDPIDGDDFEFIELQNTGASTADLSGLQFTSGVTFSFTNGSRLAPGAFWILVSDTNGFATQYPGTNWQGVYSGNFANAGETVTLRHITSGSNVLNFTYGTNWPWPALLPLAGHTLVRWSGDPALPSSWQASHLPGGSPTIADEGFIPPRVVINEIYANPSAGLAQIEFYNPTATSMDLEGWWLTDALGELKVSFGQFNDLEAFSFATYDADYILPIVLQPHGSNLFLMRLNDNTDQIEYVHAVAYGATSNGITMGRFSGTDGAEHWFPCETRTLWDGNFPATSATNVAQVPAVVINEIMPPPEPAQDEWIELYNRSASTVALNDGTNTWRLTGLEYSFSNGVSIAAGGYLLVVGTAPADFRTKYSVGGGVNIVGPYTGSLGATGRVVRLERPGLLEPDYVPRLMVDEVAYGGAGWTNNATGVTNSLHRINPASYGSEPTNWSRATPTPGS